MGKGIDLARAAGAGLHADVLDDLKDQLLVVLLKRLAKDGKVSIPVAEVDDTGHDLVSFSINEGVFNFVVSKKA
jgi:hypothetical protein